MTSFYMYQLKANATANNEQTQEEAILNYALGISGEAGEVANKVKKWRFHGHGFTTMRNEILDEIGDVLWYAACLCSALGAELEDVATENIEKLQARYPEGFSNEASINRTS